MRRSPLFVAPGVAILAMTVLSPSPATAVASPSPAAAAAPGTGWFGAPQFVTPDNLGSSTDPHQATEPTISGDGSVVVYRSDRTDLVQPDLVGWDVFYEIAGHRYQPYRQAQLVAGRRVYDAGCPNVSRDGRIIVFCSVSPKIVPADTNNTNDLFAYDRVTGTTERVDVSTSGAQSTTPYGLDSTLAAISADGRYIAFASDDALVPEDTNRAPDVYLRDRTAHTTTLVSVNSHGIVGNSLSGYDSGAFGLSGDGRYVTFASVADNLVPGDTNQAEDVFLRDTHTGTTERVSVADDGAQLRTNPVDLITTTRSFGVSDDGRYVTFYSSALGLDGLTHQHGQDVYLRDRTTHTTRLISRHRGTPSGRDSENGSYGGPITPDGRYVTFDSTSRVMNPPVRGEKYNVESRAYYMFIYVVATGQVIRFPDYSAGANLTTKADNVVYQKVRFRAFAQSIATRTLHLPG